MFISTMILQMHWLNNGGKIDSSGELNVESKRLHLGEEHTATQFHLHTKH